MNYRVKYSEQEVSAAIKRLADGITINEDTLILVLMNGGLWFAHELVERLHDRTVEVQYVKVSSYRGKTRTSLKLEYFPHIDWAQKRIIVVDDICDSGQTLCMMSEELKKYNPISIRFVTLLQRTHRMQLTDDIDLVSGICDESDDFFVGCGLDDNGKARYLPYIGVVE